ncbi:neutral zinc metallopeptidase [Arthrobacter globiformis]|uniref:neutral zinc metallopeptidase n=1 Tax=Arthrobacter globiformis TaxID=1665 RepID=UPI00278E5141|nr:neutral zinc metallopeptidase [Arthrobacter globiformis]MDQ0616758.1 putative metalloprotease [Arthrobacter globiformis]
MNKATASALLVLAVVLSGCTSNTPSAAPSTTGAQQTSAEAATQQPTTETPTSEPASASPSQEPIATQTTTSTAEAVPATPTQTISPPPTATETPSPDLTQEPVPGKVDQPAQQYEARQGERLRSNLSSETISTATMYDFLRTVLEDVHSYWAGVWTGAAYAPPTVKYLFPLPGESYPSECGASDDKTAGYCTLDDTITFSQAMATEIWNGRIKANRDPETGVSSGDFSVAFAVAHEYAHNLQRELGLIPLDPRDPREPEIYPVYKTELHADCWAGVWANSAYYKGYLQGTDVEEAQQAGRLVGDYSFDKPQRHHGTPQQRVDAFMTGYNTGTPTSCDPWLLNDYQ